MVFDASSRTPNGESLNNLLAKGKNLLPKLFDILLRFRRYNFAFSADIKSAYNNILVTKTLACTILVVIIFMYGKFGCMPSI